MGRHKSKFQKIHVKCEEDNFSDAKNINIVFHKVHPVVHYKPVKYIPIIDGTGWATTAITGHINQSRIFAGTCRTRADMIGGRTSSSIRCSWRRVMTSGYSGADDGNNWRRTCLGWHCVGISTCAARIWYSKSGQNFENYVEQDDFFLHDIEKLKVNLLCNLNTACITRKGDTSGISKIFWWMIGWFFGSRIVPIIHQNIFEFPDMSPSLI